MPTPPCACSWRILACAAAKAASAAASAASALELADAELLDRPTPETLLVSAPPAAPAAEAWWYCPCRRGACLGPCRTLAAPAGTAPDAAPLRACARATSACERRVLVAALGEARAIITTSPVAASTLRVYVTSAGPPSPGAAASPLVSSCVLASPAPPLLLVLREEAAALPAAATADPASETAAPATTAAVVPATGRAAAPATRAARRIPSRSNAGTAPALPPAKRAPEAVPGAVGGVSTATDGLSCVYTSPQPSLPAAAVVADRPSPCLRVGVHGYCGSTQSPIRLLSTPMLLLLPQGTAAVVLLRVVT